VATLVSSQVCAIPALLVIIIVVVVVVVVEADMLSRLLHRQCVKTKSRIRAESISHLKMMENREKTEKE